MKNILQMAVIATSGMTLFSYLMSFIFRENFREPELLNRLIFPVNKEEEKNHPAGFVLHLGVGTLFSVLYYSFWKSGKKQPGFLSSMGLGLINGIAGVAGWHAVLKVHTDPPGVKRVGFYSQLLAAHALFGVLNGVVFTSRVTGNGKITRFCNMDF